MGWVVLGVWIGAVVVAAVVLGFCAYELSWKGRRLAADLERMRGLSGQLAELRSGLAAARQRLADATD